MRPLYNRPANDEQLQHVEQSLGLTLPQYLRDFYLKTDGYTLLDSNDAIIFCGASTDNHIEQPTQDNDEYASYLTEIVPDEKEIGSSLVYTTHEFRQWLTIDTTDCNDADDDFDDNSAGAAALRALGFPNQFFCLAVNLSNLTSYWVRTDEPQGKPTVYVMPNPRFHDGDDHHHAFTTNTTTFTKLAKGRI